MDRLIRKQSRWIYKELSENPRLEQTGVINFEFNDKSYKFKMYLIEGRRKDWYIELLEVGDGNEIKLDRLSCNAGHKKGLTLMGELLIRRHLGGK